MNFLIVPGELDSLTAICDFVERAAAQAGLCKSDAYRLRLAVDEIATNAIEHGYAGRQGDLNLRAELNDEALVIFLEDRGPEFDPWRQPPPADLDRPLAERQPGGLGVYLARYGADSVAYKRVDGRNRISFIMKRQHTG
jgi:anti-sigma regulatory factor (Ser/Thr protein kinase)